MCRDCHRHRTRESSLDMVRLMTLRAFELRLDEVVARCIRVRMNRLRKERVTYTMSLASRANSSPDARVLIFSATFVRCHSDCSFRLVPCYGCKRSSCDSPPMNTLPYAPEPISLMNFKSVYGTFILSTLFCGAGAAVLIAPYFSSLVRTGLASTAEY